MRKQGERAAEVAIACRNEGGVMTKIAIIGATGPTGIHLAAELRRVWRHWSAFASFCWLTNLIA